jgi:hypothetical protein
MVCIDFFDWIRKLFILYKVGRAIKSIKMFFPNCIFIVDYRGGGECRITYNEPKLDSVEYEQFMNLIYAIYLHSLSAVWMVFEGEKQSGV